MKVAVVILNWNQAADTAHCVHELLAWPLEAEHIWVVDNASAPADRTQLQRDCSAVHLQYSEINCGFAGGNNLALAEILCQDYEAVLLLNNDASLDKGSFEHLCNTLAMYPEVGIVGPTLWDATDPRHMLSAGGLDIAYHVASHRLEPVECGQLPLVDYVPGTCALIRTSVLSEVGLLNEDFFFGGEVAAFCASAIKCGFSSAIDGCAKALHAVDRSSLLRRDLHTYYIIRNRFLFTRLFHSQAQFALYLMWTAYAAYNGLLALLHGDTQHARAISLGCIDGWTRRYGGQNERVLRDDAQRASAT